MATTPEGKVKNKVKKILDDFGVYHFSPYMAGMGRTGVPDIIGCLNGRFIAIEVKAGNNKPTPLQARELDRIVTTKGVALVITEQNLDELIQTLHNIKGE